MNSGMPRHNITQVAIKQLGHKDFVTNSIYKEYNILRMIELSIAFKTKLQNNKTNQITHHY